MSGDAELFAAALAGGPEACAPIVARYQDAVFGVALARLRDFHEAQDVAQEVFVTAFERLGGLKDPARLGAWLRSVTIHHSIDRLRRRDNARPIEAGQVRADHGSSPHAELEQQELRDAVMAAIGRLSKTQRETTALFYINGYSIAEVAAIQEVPAGTVKGRLHDARRKLREDMLGMVENVLKSEAPKEALGQRVFDVLSQRGKHEHEIMVALRRLGAEGAVDGFLKAAESSHADTRKRAVDSVGLFDAPKHHDMVAELLERRLRDPNQNVRAGVIRAAMEYFACSDDRKRDEFVPLIVELLFDSARAVRATAAFQLERGWAADVPLDRAARALVEEPNRVVRGAKEDLLRAVLNAQASCADPPVASGQADERLAGLKQKLDNPNSAVRASAVPALLYLPMNLRPKREEVVPVVVGMLKDRSRRVRWRTAYELCGWAADVPIDVVEKAYRAETHAGTRRQMERLLRKATAAQEGATTE